eukprot:gb/GFBE01026436.1/.p1 GENE.gb/GFBE01026436.1/~~gb/GFBE01026436.1/.p1  ORF type:complete len:450 (+),score=71.63 gb/GFBE01026436.1/:1-1350(+)
MSMSYTDPNTGETKRVPQGGTLPFNEVNFNCTGTRGLVGIFVRSLEVQHVLLALGVSALIEHALGTSLPLVLLDSSSPVRPVDRRTRLALVQEVLKAGGHKGLLQHLQTPRLPLDLKAFSGLTEQEKLVFHCKYGATASNLEAIFSKYAQRPAELLQLVSLGLRVSAESKNAPSAREIVRASAPLIVNASQSMRGGESLDDHPCASALEPTSPRCLSLVQNLVQKSLVEVKDICANVEESSEDILVALGAQIVLQEFCSGRTSARLENAIDELKAWLEMASSSCSIMGVFLMQSWLTTWSEDKESRLSAFLSGDAVSNRSSFLGGLKKLQHTRSGEPYVRQLYDLVNSLHSPCLRFRVLREVLGLSERFSRSVVHGIVCLAYDIFVAHPRSAFEVDEATRLEAEECTGGGRGRSEVLGVAAPHRFSSDPLGVESRRCRAQYREHRCRKS